METLVSPQPFIPSLPVCSPVGQAASFSRFSFFTKPIENKQPTMEFSLVDAYNYIRGGVSALATARLRSLPSARRPSRDQILTSAHSRGCFVSARPNNSSGILILCASTSTIFQMSKPSPLHFLATHTLRPCCFSAAHQEMASNGSYRWNRTTPTASVSSRSKRQLPTTPCFSTPYSIIYSLPILSKSMRSARTFPALASFRSTLMPTSIHLCHD